ncbi:hypothetical protein [Cryptosporangium japonicum]|uniref:Uncharacterized protein n=1 Tax=Cryptosporangium japonicum TaxID=80872 RepID=A0ABN0UY29_9ACTN
MTSRSVPPPRDAIAARAAGDDHGLYWTAVLYGADYALLLGRDAELLDALTAVVASGEEARR